MKANDEQMELVRQFLASDKPAVLDLSDLEGRPQLRRLDGRMAIEFYDEDQIFFFTGVYIATPDGIDKYLCFQTSDFDIMVKVDKDTDLDAIPESMEDKGKAEKLHITDAEFEDVLDIALSEIRQDGGNVIEFGNRYRLEYDDYTDSLELSGDNLLSDYTVQSVMDYGIPFGGLVIELSEWRLFFRNYTSVDRGEQ